MTMPIQQEVLANKIAELSTKFARALPDRLNNLANALRKCEVGFPSRDDVVALHRLLHVLAGSSGTFGFFALGQVTAELEERLNAMIEQNQNHGLMEGFAEIGPDINALLNWALVDPQSPPAEVVQNFRHRMSPLYTPELADKPIQAIGSQELLLYVVGIESDEKPHLLRQLENFGYRIRVFQKVATLAMMIAEQTPSVLVVDMGREFDSTELRALQATLPNKIPVLFLASDSRFQHRLVAAQADADGYFVKPVDMVALNARLECLLRREEKLPYRILVIDDDKCITDYYCLILRGAGMEVAVLHNPSEIFNSLAEFRPELLLMDVYMPMCSGLILARIIRQESTYLDMPIVFLSTENNAGKQIDAIQSGADDFLTKPMPAGYLISSLTNRVERYRGLRELIVRDSLTKLYNHSSLVERASVEIERAKRHHKPLAFAMIDLDYFKNVNENYGHLVGDNVIRSLAQLLQKSLRRLDVVGRYGGEEFGVILPETTALAAFQVIDKVRNSFSRIKHYSTDHRWYFEVTFSAGVVELNDQTDVGSLLDHADKALYSAKSGGRNRVKRY